MSSNPEQPTPNGPDSVILAMRFNGNHDMADFCESLGKDDGIDMDNLKQSRGKGAEPKAETTELKCGRCGSSLHWQRGLLLDDSSFRPDICPQSGERPHVIAPAPIASVGGDETDEAWVKDEARYPDAVAFQSGPRDKPEWRIVSPAVGIRYGNGVLGEPMRMFDTPAEAWVDTRRRLEAADASWIKQAAEREDGAFVSVGGLITDLESASTAAEPVHDELSRTMALQLEESLPGVGPFLAKRIRATLRRFKAESVAAEPVLEVFSEGVIDPDCEEEDCTYCRPYRNARAALAAYREMGLGK